LIVILAHSQTRFIFSWEKYPSRKNNISATWFFLAAFSKPSSCFGLADTYLHRSTHGSSKRLKIHLLFFSE